MKKSDQKVSLITGAGSGMGRAAALLFASEGSKVVATDIDQKRLECLLSQKHKAKSRKQPLIRSASKLFVSKIMVYGFKNYSILH